MTNVTAVMIAYHNEDKAITRLARDLLPALRNLHLMWELIVIDNSDTRSHRLAAYVAKHHGRYEWQRGENLRYGAALNRAVELATKPYLVYVCSEHGRNHDDTWIDDLLDPLEKDTAGLVAMTGCIQDAGPPENAGFPAHLPPIHIQGGVFAARTDLLRAYPYTGGDFHHWGADIYECFALLDAGYRLLDVPSVRSVWRATVEGDGFKYVHDES